jgi:hypothetical protein
MTKNISMRCGVLIGLRFELVQHTRDLKVLEKIIGFLGCGTLHKRANKATASVLICKLSDILNIFIPLLERYPLQGAKKANFIDFCRVAVLMRDKAHRTKEERGVKP